MKCRKTGRLISQYSILISACKIFLNVGSPYLFYTCSAFDSSNGMKLTWISTLRANHGACRQDMFRCPLGPNVQYHGQIQSSEAFYQSLTKEEKQ